MMQRIAILLAFFASLSLGAESPGELIAPGVVQIVLTNGTSTDITCPEEYFMNAAGKLFLPADYADMEAECLTGRVCAAQSLLGKKAASLVWENSS